MDALGRPSNVSERQVKPMGRPKALAVAPGAHQGRVPMALESEQAALGAAIRDPSGAFCELLAGELVQEDFYGAKTGSVYRAVSSLLEESLTVNPVSVAERSAVPRAEVDALIDAAAGVGEAQLKTLVSDLRRIGELRSVYQACQNATGMMNSASKVEEVVEALENHLYRSDRSSGNESKDGADVMAAVVDDFLRRQKIGGGVEISSGVKELDRAIIGLRPGKMMVIAGRPAMGKTALSDTIRRAVCDQGYGAIQFSLEMDKEEILERELAMRSQVNHRKILTATGVTEDELSRVQKARESMVSGRWIIDDRTYSIGGMRRKARIIAGRMARANVKLGCVIIDYIQLAGENGDGREQSVAAISRGCKLMAKELGCTVMALSQLNRSCEYRDDKRPLMSDLRESGSIEQDADIIGFVYREHAYDASYPPEEAEFIVRKHRGGPTGTVRMSFNTKTVSFTDCAQTESTSCPPLH